MTEEILVSDHRRTCGLCYGPIEKGAEYVYTHYDKRKLGTVTAHYPRCPK
jgi:hypothetical protein